MGAEDFVKLHVNCRSDFALTELSDRGELAFYRALVYCGLNATFGLIPRRDLSQVGTPRAADELVAKGYWQIVPQGWAIRSWDKWQGDFDQVQIKRKKDAERKRETRRKAREQMMEESE